MDSSRSWRGIDRFIGSLGGVTVSRGLCFTRKRRALYRRQNRPDCPIKRPAHNGKVRVCALHGQCTENDDKKRESV